MIAYAHVGYACQQINLFAHTATICTQDKASQPCHAQKCSTSINSNAKLACDFRRTTPQSMRYAFGGNQCNWRVRQKPICSPGMRITKLSTVKGVHTVAIDVTMTGDKCNAINSSSLIPELEDGNKFPGNTACVESCVCPGCDCFFPSPGCLFYRIYMEPINDQVYEIFQCNRWREIAKAEITHVGDTRKKSSTLTIQLILNVPFKWKSFTLTSASFTKPPIPLLNRQFITDGRIISISIWKTNALQHCDAQTPPMPKLLIAKFLRTARVFQQKPRPNADAEKSIGAWFNNIRNQLPAIFPSISFRRHLTSRIQATRN